MNTLNKIGVILLWITLGFVLPIQAQIRGLYDMNVTFSSHWTQSGWDTGSKIVIEKDLVIHPKVNFIFPSSIPTTYTNPISDPEPIGFVKTVAVSLYVKFGNSPNENWKLCTNGASFLIDYTALMSSVGEENKTNIIVQFAMAAGGVLVPGTTNEYSSLGSILRIISSDLTIKHAPNRPYIAPNTIIDIETDNVFVPPASIYAPITLQSTTFFTPYTQNTKGKGNAYVLYANPEKPIITKPIIFVDGIDFGRTDFIDPTINKVVRHGVTGWDVFIRGLDEDYIPSGEKEAYRLYKSTFNQLRAKGFDIVFLDFTEGATFIEKNAQVLRKLIYMLNSGDPSKGILPLKKADGQGRIHENIIVGCSMGGQVTRLCLSEMEKNGESTCTSTYVAFDSPHLGANIPLSMQSLAWFAANALGDKSLWNRLNTPAARQLLNETLGDAVKTQKVKIREPSWSDPMNFSFPDTYDLHTAFQTKVHQLGLPTTTRNLAISCGSNKGSSGLVSNSIPQLHGDVKQGDKRVIAINLNSNIGKSTSNVLTKICTGGQATNQWVTGNSSVVLGSSAVPYIFTGALPYGFQKNILPLFNSTPHHVVILELW